MSYTSRSTILEQIDALISKYTNELIAEAHSEGYDEGFADQADATMAAFDNGYETALSSIKDSNLTYDDGYEAGFETGEAAGIALQQDAAYEQGYADGELEGSEQSAEGSFEFGYELGYAAAIASVKEYLDNADR
jgi:flagellar biosynthesis/type III secretory pathway protein FliH